MSDDRIIQIMPVQGLWVEYSNPAGPIIEPVLCAGLQANGLIVFLDNDSHGHCEVVTESANFVCIRRDNGGDHEH